MDFALENGVNAIALGSLYALIALGIALIFGIMRLVNVAHGELIMTGGYALALTSQGLGLPARMGIAVLVSAVFALVMERFAFRPMRNANPATLLVASFAVSYLLQNLAILIFGAEARSTFLHPALTEAISVGSLSIPKISLITLLTGISLLGLLRIFLRRTNLGIQMRAAAEDFTTARVLGVRAHLVIASAFAISGVLAGAVAILLVGQTGTVSPTMGLGPLLVGLVATVIGGMGSLVGAVAGGYILGSLSIALQAGLPLGARPFRDALLFAAVILILLLRPQGLVAHRARV